MGVAIKFTWPRTRDSESRRQAKPAAKQRRSSERGKQEQPPARARKGKATQSKGATRKTRPAVTRQPRSFSWLNRILILVGAGVVLVAALQAWIALQQIPVEQITVTGELTHTRTTAVQEMVQPALGGGFLGADLQQVREQLEALPWIYEASVRRIWPNALEIHVVEQLPIARWGETSFLNHEGEVFRPSNRQAWEALPLLRGPEGAADALMSTYQRLVDMLAPLGLGVTQLQMDERGQVEAVLAGGQQLLIGSDDFLGRMHRFTTVYRAELAARMDEVERVDLRYERGVAVAFREISPGAELKTESKKA